jgi:hypothetical protein
MRKLRRKVAASLSFTPALRTLLSLVLLTSQYSQRPPPVPSLAVLARSPSPPSLHFPTFSSSSSPLKDGRSKIINIISYTINSCTPSRFSLVARSDGRRLPSPPSLAALRRDKAPLEDRGLPDCLDWLQPAPFNTSRRTTRGGRTGSDGESLGSDNKGREEEVGRIGPAVRDGGILGRG